MALQQCTECGGKVSSTAKACPHCGAAPTQAIDIPPMQTMPTQKKKRRIWPWVVGGIVLWIFIAGTHKRTPEEQAEYDKRKAAQAITDKAEQDTRKTAQAITGKAEQSTLSDANKELIWIERSKKAVKEKLKDPDSAQFKGVYFFRGRDNTPMTCGQVNSKNSFGGFTGFQHFISAASSDLTFLESEVEDFSKAWKAYCKK